MNDQDPQQVILLARELDLAIIDGHNPAAEINGQPHRPKPRLFNFRLEPVTQGRPDTGQQLPIPNDLVT